jgi:heme-degrading monooxygenase HmoA
MAALIMIKRKIPRDKQTKILPLLIQMRSLAVARPGYISGQTLQRIDDPEEYLVIGTWKSADHWESWFKSKQRNEIQAQIDQLLGEKTDYTAYHYPG